MNTSNFYHKKRTNYSANHQNRDYKLFNGELFPDKFFGQTEADIEWDEDKDLSSKLFIHTESYDIFKKQSNLFLFGRRGTGKTAIIKMLDYEVKKRVEKGYTYSKIIAQEDTFYKLTLELRNCATNISKSEITHIIKEKVVWVIYTSAMISIVDSNREKIAANPSLTIISDYLKEMTFIKDEGWILTTSPIVKSVDIFSDHLQMVGYDPQKAGVALLQANRELHSKNYENALNAMVTFLTQYKESCLVLIDSQELYDFKDKLSEAATTGLMDAVLQIYNQNKTYKVFSKVAFPSEIFPHLNPTNQSKTRDKGHFIFWGYKDLIAFICRRYCQVLYAEELIDIKCDKIENINFSEFIYQYLPRNTFTYGGVEFETLPYIISHTQKKPREIILLFNLILTLARKNDISFDTLTSDCIREGTNARIEDLSSGVLDMYRLIYPKAVDIVNKTFTQSSNVLSYGDLQKQLNEANPLLAEAGMTKLDAERLFLETGIIGLLHSETKLGETKKTLITAEYEYQIKGVLTIQSKNWLIIHPIFYQGLNINVDSDSLVYPKPSTTEAEEFSSIKFK